MAVKRKIALVTGANRGLGVETCRQLAQLGLTVIMSARDLTKGQIAAKLLLDKGLDVLFYQLDVSDQINISKITLQLEQEFGQLDVVVNKALITNLFGPWRLSQLCIPIMKRNKYGRIVNVSSGPGSLSYMGSGTP